MTGRVGADPEGVMMMPNAAPSVRSTVSETPLSRHNSFSIETIAGAAFAAKTAVQRASSRNPGPRLPHPPPFLTTA